MLQSFLVAFAMEILKYYAPKGVANVLDYWKERQALKENEKKAGKYQPVVDSPAGRDERRKAEDEALG